MMFSVSKPYLPILVSKNSSLQGIQTAVVSVSVKLASSRHILITRVYSLYQSQALTIKDVSKNDWYKQYLIPIEYMEKASSLYLGIDKKLPYIFYNQSDYKY